VIEIGDVVREGFALVLALSWPLVGAAVAGVLAGGIAARLTGLQDPAVGLVTRMIAVVVAIALLATGMAAAVQAFTDETWSALSALGRGDGEPPSP
jgi:type III secretory pathway component EscS